MADSATEPDASTGRRHRRDERRRRRTRRALAVVASAAVFALFVVLATDAVRFGGDDRPSLAGTAQPVEPDDTQASASTASTALAARQCRTLSTTDPLRLWVGGDSLAGSLGPALGTIAGATGVVQPYFDSRVSSGLSSPGFFDWPARATVEMARLDPEVVVFIIGTNDAPAASGDSWKAEYAQEVDSMMKTLIGSGRTVYWVGAPTLKDKDMDAGAVKVNAVAQEVAKRHGEVHYVDAYKLFSDANGEFAGDLPDETGKVVTMRAGDGVHFTMDGGDYLARKVYELVDAQCGVTAQQVAGVTKPTIESEGSTQVAPGSGSSSDSGSNNNTSGGGTIATTPPAPAPTTSPPVTSPPVTTPITAPQTTAPATTTPTTAPIQPATP